MSEQVVLSIIVPAHNEAENLERLCKELDLILPMIGVPCEAILVSDHSSDGTLAIANDHKKTRTYLRVCKNDGAQGMGFALMRGIREAKGRYVAFVVGDATTPLETLPPMVQMILRRKLDMVIFSRYSRTGDATNLPLRYRFWSTIFRLALRLCLGMKLRDPTVVYRVMKRDFFSNYNIRHGDFSFSAEISVKGWQTGLKIEEFPGSQKMRVGGRSSFRFRRMAGPYSAVLLEGIRRRIKMWVLRGYKW